MRISDWSSDVCSSDLGDLLLATSDGLYRAHDHQLHHLLPESPTAPLGVRYLLRRHDGPWLAGGRGGPWRVSAYRLLPFPASAELPATLDVTALYEWPACRLHRKHTRLHSTPSIAS